MRSILWFVTFIVVVGAFVAHYADKAIVNLNSKSVNTEAASRMSSSSSETTRIVTVSPPERPPSAIPQTPSKPALPQVIILSPSSGRAVTLRIDRDGQFRVEARVDARKFDFVVDTGAGAVALRASDAAKLGIHPMERDYTIKTQTANGVGRAALVRLGMIEIENIVVRDVPAIVVHDDALKENLLGMTFLSKVRWTHDRGKLVLEQLSNN